MFVKNTPQKGIYHLTVFINLVPLKKSEFINSSL